MYLYGPPPVSTGRLRIRIFGWRGGTLLVRRPAVPFETTVAMRKHTGWLTARGWTRELKAGKRLSVPPLTRFDLSIAPGAIAELALQADADLAALAEAVVDPARRPARPGRSGTAAPQSGEMGQ